MPAPALVAATRAVVAREGETDRPGEQGDRTPYDDIDDAWTPHEHRPVDGTGLGILRAVYGADGSTDAATAQRLEI